eukprot:3654542-Pleurochrysis_carterae.AAC.5
MLWHAVGELALLQSKLPGEALAALKRTPARRKTRTATRLSTTRTGALGDALVCSLGFNLLALRVFLHGGHAHARHEAVEFGSNVEGRAAVDASPSLIDLEKSRNASITGSLEGRSNLVRNSPATESANSIPSWPWYLLGLVFDAIFNVLRSMLLIAPAVLGSALWLSRYLQAVQPERGVQCKHDGMILQGLRGNCCPIALEAVICCYSREFAPFIASRARCVEADGTSVPSSACLHRSCAWAAVAKCLSFLATRRIYH